MCKNKYVNTQKRSKVDIVRVNKRLMRARNTTKNKVQRRNKRRKEGEPRDKTPFHKRKKEDRISQKNVAGVIATRPSINGREIKAGSNHTNIP
jgi:hypothetical protein